MSFGFVWSLVGVGVGVSLPLQIHPHRQSNMRKGAQPFSTGASPRTLGTGGPKCFIFLLQLNRKGLHWPSNARYKRVRFLVGGQKSVRMCFSWDKWSRTLDLAVFPD